MSEMQWRPIDTAPQDGTLVWIDICSMPDVTFGGSTKAAPIFSMAEVARWSTWDFCWRLPFRNGEMIQPPKYRRPKIWCPFIAPPPLAENPA